MILSDNETKLDLLNNQAIAKTIVSIVHDSTESVSIGVHGDWGAGKSSVLAMVEDYLNPNSSEDDTLPNDLYDDVFAWDAWDDTDPEEATDEEIDLDITGYITVRFNSWQYQGFEDAKIALMSAIVKALQNEAKAFYTKHPVKGAIKKLKGICKNVWKNLDKLSLAKNVAKMGVSLATGTAPLALLDIASKYAKDIFTDDEKRNSFINTAGELLKNTSSETSSYKEMTEFRTNYLELFKAAHIKKLVVLIDDLDRCLPKVAIETLEAVRMFLAMENTAFIIAADDEMIRYSVKEYFPRVLEKEDGTSKESIDYNRFSDKYLEKLIQIPLHIPRIGIEEARLYVLLLMIESQTGESDELKALADAVIKKLNKPWALEQLSTEELKGIMGSAYDDVLDKIIIAKNIDTFLAQHTGGNPRNIKRFVNMLLLRMEVARNRGFDETDLEMSVLAKMMLVEQYHPEFYKAIASELREDGTCPVFEPVSDENKSVKSIGSVKSKGKTPKPLSNVGGSMNEKKELPIEKYRFTNPNSNQTLINKDIVAWIESDPLLSGVDLRPYFFACKEQEDFFFSSQEDRVKEVILAVRSGKFATTSKTKQIEALTEEEAQRVFDIIKSETFKKDLSVQKEPQIIGGLRAFVENRTELQSSLVDFLLTLPADKIGVWAIGGWEKCIPKESQARQKLDEFIKKIEEQSTNPLIKKVAEMERGK